MSVELYRWFCDDIKTWKKQVCDYPKREVWSKTIEDFGVTMIYVGIVFLFVSSCVVWNPYLSLRVCDSYTGANIHTAAVYHFETPPEVLLYMLANNEARFAWDQNFKEHLCEEGNGVLCTSIQNTVSDSDEPLVMMEMMRKI